MSKKEKKKAQQKALPKPEETVSDSESDSDADEAVKESQSQDLAHESSDHEDSNEEHVESNDNGEEEEEEQGDSDNEKDKSKDDKKKRKKSKQVFGEDWLAETENFNVKLKKRGVIYVARVPPRMTPTKLKSLLSEFGEVTRVYLVEEDKTVRQRRRKQGGSGSKRYTEGWVEFAKKSIAKHVAQNLNTTPISNYKRSSHYGDLWNLKYLHKFKWSHLTEKVAYERRVREQKLRVEMLQARRENASYVELVETGKKLDRIEERKRKRMEREGTTPKEDSTASKRKKHNKKQKQPREERGDAAAQKALLQSLV
ncbi:Activator of basal transcription 1 [Seminavis robusta]|uniref:Activator of basal transcription 1 n=1 Tax=Seminavis robusta TaxID=568900 RepID=A0A9N8DU39_9STRA|nr:Activator of basal transcription 1 [Seminavis robusta]|eukprot:Sro352_g124240.1 Activator of basal transcription 1 (312) ;mRNA; r:35516-36578